MKPQYRPPKSDSPLDREVQLRGILDQFGDADASGLLGPVAIGTSETRVPHGKGNPPLGWVLVSPDALATVCQTKAADGSFLYLKASVAVNARIQIF